MELAWETAGKRSVASARRIRCQRDRSLRLAYESRCIHQCYPRPLGCNSPATRRPGATIINDDGIIITSITFSVADDWASTATARRNGFPPPASGSQGRCRFTCVSRLPSANSELSRQQQATSKSLRAISPAHRLRRRKAGPVCSRRAACPSSPHHPCC